MSDLSFISNIPEKVGWIQLPQYRDCVVSVLDGLLVSKDEKLVSLVALLDLSATFDTLDHLILLKQLETTHHM